ncbi:hypothetical protein TRFO_18571 [Tritrichomonas foetus]|uniref:Uncharacterized protein n=1 Tax=Tritrichomonas foetus TaxID=1144522 RepID=A0A1J4KL61_9EUKA|nr:hypothetical protein TRFO_18571 [Tritrichomonas foetus]|eukprot:OHT11874.1 hypothetical protein TRFO_18571 [Tritrichomonas foetus]
MTINRPIIFRLFEKKKTNLVNFLEKLSYDIILQIFMNIDRLLKQHQDYFQPRIELQERLMDLSQDNIGSFIEYLISEKFLENKILCSFFLNSLSSAINIRPTKFDLYIQITEEFQENIKNFFSSENLFFEIFQENIVRLKLIKIGLIDKKTLSQISYIDKPTIEFFAKEINDQLSDFFAQKDEKFLKKGNGKERKDIEKLISRVLYTNNVNSKNKSKSDINDLQYDTSNFNEDNTIDNNDQEDDTFDFNKYEELRNFKKNEQILYNIDKIATIIDHDDVSEFQTFLASTNTSINGRVHLSESQEFYFPYSNPTFIEYSMMMGSFNIFKFLFINDAIIKDDYSPRFAIAGGNYEIIHMIEQKIPNSYNEISLCMAVRYHQNQILDYLHETLGINYNYESLSASVRFNNLKAFTESVFSLRENPNIRGIESETILYTCVNFGRIELLKFLCQIDGIDINSKSIGVGWTPLHLATSYHSSEIIKFICSLIQHKTNNQNNDKIDTKMQDTVCNQSAVQNVDVNAKAENGGITPLHIAVKNCDCDLVEYFCSLDTIDVNAENNIGYTPLHFAAQTSFNAFKILCEHPSIDMNHSSKDGDTPLICAILFQNLEVVKFLCSRNDVDFHKKKGDKTPLQISKTFSELHPSSTSQEIYQLIFQRINDLE